MAGTSVENCVGMFNILPHSGVSLVYCIPASCVYPCMGGHGRRSKSGWTP